MLLLTIIIPVHRPKVQHFSECLISIRNQSLDPSKFIVHFLFDGDHSNSNVELIEKILGEATNYKITKVPRLGLIRTLNLGLDKCETQYFARMDSDDIMHPDRLNQQLNHMNENPDLALCGSRIEYIDESGNDISRMGFNYPLSDFHIRITGSLYNNPFAHPSIIGKTSIAKELGGYTSDPPLEDYALWSKYKKYKIENMSEKLLKYRIHPNQLTHSNAVKYKLLIKIRLNFFYSLVTRYGLTMLPMILILPLIFIPIRIVSIVSKPIKKIFFCA